MTSQKMYMFILLFWEMVRGGTDMEKSRINDYSQKMTE